MLNLLATPSDAVIVQTLISLAAVVGSLCTMLGQKNLSDATKKNREKDAEERQIIAQKVDDHSEALNQKLNENARELEKNTNITVEATTNAARAYDEANSFNKKFAKLEHLEEELKRLSSNIHRIANSLMPVLAKYELEMLELDKRKEKK